MDKDGEGMGCGLGTYDYRFRMYNPAICWFLRVDPLKASILIIESIRYRLHSLFNESLSLME